MYYQLPSSGQLEETLDSFLAPSRPLENTVKKTYEARIKSVARRFFQLLLRYRRIDRALCLAEKINAKDLFMDLHFAALKCNEKTLAQKAQELASNLLVSSSLIGNVVTVHHIFLSSYTLQQRNSHMSYSEYNNIIIHPYASQQNDIFNWLKGFKYLPPNCKGDDPDDDATGGIQNHPGGGIHCLCDCESSKVEEGNTEQRCNKYLS
ncbi:hypothetical protein EMCRGX_G020740 [Ephydatia muelleri]|eukprot:Em0016g675a